MKRWLVILAIQTPPHLPPQIPLHIALQTVNLNVDESSEPEDPVLMQVRSHLALPFTSSQSWVSAGRPAASGLSGHEDEQRGYRSRSIYSNYWATCTLNWWLMQISSSKSRSGSLGNLHIAQWQQQTLRQSDRLHFPSKPPSSWAWAVPSTWVRPVLNYPDGRALFLSSALTGQGHQPGLHRLYVSPRMQS